MSNGRRALYAGGLVVVAGLIGGFWWWSSQPVTEYQTAQVSKGNIESSVSAVGTVQPREFVDVGVQVSGQVTRLFVTSGDEVKRGDLLAEIDPSILQARVDAGRAQLAMLEAQLQERQAQVLLAQQQDARQQQLMAQNATSTELAQTAHAEYAVAQARVRQLQASIQQTSSELKADEATLGYTRIYAPMSGTVLTVDVTEGQTLNATYQTPPLLRLADLSVMRVQVKVSEADIHLIRAGQEVRFATLGNTRRHWLGQVAQVLPAPPVSAEEDQVKAVMYSVLFDVNNRDGALMPGMTAQADFIIAQADNVLVVPVNTVDYEDAQPVVHVLNAAGQPEVRAVRQGQLDRIHVEITDGLHEGETLIVRAIQHPRRRDSW